MSLLDNFKSAAESMPLGEKILASLQVTVLGIGIVFSALLLLYVVISLMSKLIMMAEGKTQKAKEVITLEPNVPVEEAQEDQSQLIAVITAAVAASLNTTTQQILVKNIVRIGGQQTPWANAGLRDQMRD